MIPRLMRAPLWLATHKSGQLSKRSSAGNRGPSSFAADTLPVDNMQARARSLGPARSRTRSRGCRPDWQTSQLRPRVQNSPPRARPQHHC